MKKKGLREKLVHVTYDKQLLNRTVAQYYRDMQKAAEALEKLTEKKQK